jgi:N-formylmaleamate deformylase
MSEKENNMKWKTGYINSNGNNLFYTRTGGDKPPFLLAHGGSDDSGCWMDHAMRLEKDYEVVMYDAIGHGNSPRIIKDKPVDLVSDMRNVIKGLNLEKPGIWGHSMGAATTAGYAALYSDEVNLIILEDVPWFDDPKTMREERIRSYTIPGLQKGSLQEAIDMSRKVHPRHMDSIHERWALSKMKFDTDGIALVPEMLPIPEKWQDQASKITCPTLILTADVGLGAIVTTEVAKKALDIMQNAQWSYIPNAGHTIRYEQFEIVMGVVINFLNHNYS